MDSNIKIIFPSNSDLVEINNAYIKSYDRFRSYGLLTADELDSFLVRNKMIEEDILDGLNKLEGMSALKYRKIKGFATENLELKYIENQILKIMLGYKYVGEQDPSIIDRTPEDDQYFSLISLKNKYIKLTCDALADQERKLLLVYYCCVNSKTGKRLWKSLNDFFKDRNNSYIKLLISETNSFLSGIGTSILRRIARHPAWRTRWISATKTGAVLFSGNISDWDVNKTMLCYWSNFYDNIYAEYERPEDFIIKDDEMLDNWLENQVRDSGQSNSSDPSKDTVRGIFRPNVAPVKRKK